MAEGFLPTELLQEAIEGFKEFSARFAAIAEAEPDPLPDYVAALRQLPAGDTPRKRELAKFFQTEAGSKYSTVEREAAYNELLGRERNRENMG